MNKDAFVLFTDGGSRGNPGSAAIGIIIKKNEQVVKEFAATIGITTNNVAEYQALIKGLRLLEPMITEPVSVTLCLDSELVVRQMLGQYKIKQPHLLDLKREADKCLLALKSKGVVSAEWHHIPRKLNADADALVNQALDAAK